ncbi:ABATE domain-containing protein [Planomonospora alba]|uniref:ABATE domain-containing protein n=1 Tax=Planomonospora alba TaxID=161354 RepID=UPI003CD0B414
MTGPSSPRSPALGRSPRPDRPDAMLGFARRLREAIDRAVMAAAGGGLPDARDLSLINGAAMAAPRPAP